VLRAAGAAELGPSVMRPPSAIGRPDGITRRG
jgi:hypothetical protein